MRNTILLAGILTVGVLLLFVGLILGVRIKISGEYEKGGIKTASESRFVPPLERIMREREETEKKAAKETYHTKAAPPKVKIYQTSYKEGTQVTFNHAKHVEEYKLNCIECHHVEKCGKCHFKGESHTMDVAKGKQAFHENCIGCHSESKGPEECLDCHKQ